METQATSHAQGLKMALASSRQGTEFDSSEQASASDGDSLSYRCCTCREGPSA